MLSCGMALITGQDQIWWKESSQTTPHHGFRRARRGRALPRGPSANARRCRQRRMVLTFLEKSQMLFDDGDAAPSLQPAKSQSVAARAQCTDRVSRDRTCIISAESPPSCTISKPRSPSLLPVRGVKREPTSVNTHDRRRRATSLHPAGAPVAEPLEAQPPSSAYARADNISALRKHQPLLGALHHCLHG